MQIHLPIAELAVDPFVIIAIGTGVGFVSGLFGVGGGFLLTPLLMFAGVPAAIAVSTQANQVLATSIAGASSHWKNRAVDMRLGYFMMGGGLAGSALGVWVFKLLRAAGNIDEFIAISYVVFLGIVGGLMFWESIGPALGKNGDGNKDPKRRSAMRAWTRVMPFKRRFPRSGLYISMLPPIIIGFVVGFLAAVLGVGGGFILAPAMVYLLGVPTRVMIGTSLFQIIFLTAFVTFLQAAVNQTVDLVLAAVLMSGGVIGAKLGAATGQYLNAAQLRFLLALVVLAMGGKLAYDLIFGTSAEFALEALK
ncbi:sulfite exporter TauE/SafE family protein [Hirschia maritima]|uniref:sulfite exporter TauE/SafE family protein n=1 Tax=Hirschia maritima TaxID=1121961 RepID=UPI000370665E|nr:sulfite exporter TauE/SafE family protein [Hirschia maritima]